jgi:hypothetical protein
MWSFEKSANEQAAEDHNSESSFISESDDDADEYGDIGEYGSRNYRAGIVQIVFTYFYYNWTYYYYASAFDDSMPYSDPMKAPSPADPLVKRKRTLATPMMGAKTAPSSPQRAGGAAADPNEGLMTMGGGEDEFRCTHRDFCQYCQQEMRGFPRNWNEEFQSLLELPVTTEKERLKRYELIHNLAQGTTFR